MKKALIQVSLLAIISVALYQFVPGVRHWVYYRYFILTRPEVVGGPCGPNCNGHDEYPSWPMSHIDTLPDFLLNDTNRINVSGVVHDINGKPAAGIILYVFQANTSGIYPKRGSEKGADTLNGYLRSWIKTDSAGRYGFFTNRPGAYPGTKRMAHIHCIVKEPNLNAYTLPDFVFPDDPNLTPVAKKTSQQDNGGLLIRAGDKNDIVYYRRHMYLGRNVVNYPKK